MNLIGNINAIPFRRFRGGGGVAPIPPFPSIPGMIARYSALGFTNEQMAENPVWKDLTGNGHDLQMKNFAWGGMSGVGGYTENYNSNKWYKVRSRIDVTWTYKSFNARSIKDNRLAQLFYQSSLSDTGFRVLSCTIKVSGLTDGQGIEYVSNGTRSTVIMRIENDGIYHLPSFDFGAKNAYYGFRFLKLQESCNITIEQLPLYPGFILGDGVDDEAATIDNLDLEDTYTVYTPLILLKYGGVVSGKSSAKDFSLNTVVSSKSIGFDSANAWSGSIPVDLFEFVLVVCKRDPKTMYVKDLITGKANQRNSKEFVPNPGKYFIWRNTGGSWCQVAIAGQTICNGYFSTDEDDEKVLDWYKKQYPWLFPDQAWTVTGKTNEDEDRATIANITGNGNDLVLSNFAFSGNSGYGEYAYNFSDTSWISIPDYGVISDKTSKSFNIKSFVLADYPVLYTAVNKDSSIKKVKIKVTNSIPGFYFGNKPANQIIDLSTDGIYEIPSYNSPNDVTQYGFRCSNVNDSCNITIEQIPEYEGYLITDGVDDEVRSAAFTLNEDWTIVGNWEFITNENKNAGLTKVYSFYLYNRDYGIFVYEYLNAGQGFSVEDVKSLKAICSDGRIYLNDWQEIRNNIEQEATISKGVMAIGYFNRDFTKMAFKNLGIYNNQLLSKDDCIKAYNYLQTLKAK